MQVVVLSMHRCGSSLLASILVDLGVNMGDDLFMRGKNQPYGHWEDRDFLHLNTDVLKAVHAGWNIIPPPREKIVRIGKKLFGKRIDMLMWKKNKRKKWGWKDPRTSLTIDLYEPYLVNPRYIRIARKKEDAVRSLIKRHHGGRGWGRLYNEYIRRADEFLEDKECLTISYGALLDKRTRKLEIHRINDYVSGNGKVEKAMGRVKT